ncbi:MAG: hypothetical protein PHC34_09505 [Candidatus Gastranaerophilales bacterium]|nr:hypothetical protein [Candidatus Gastranaerophilales bacterium]
MSSCILISYIFLSMLSANFDSDIYLNGNEETVVPVKGVLSGNISKSKELPQELYGTWSVTSVVLETNDPATYYGRGSDIWTLQKGRDVITLSNPSTGASASITVDEVIGFSATFTRIENTDKTKEHEQVSITVDGDNFYGSDSIEIEHYKKGKYLYTSIVKYDVMGKKISGPAIKEIFSE